jgi:inosose dehydratase
MSSKIIISTAPCSWGVWYADGSPAHTPYEVFLDQAAASGYKELEMGPDGYLPVDNIQLHDELGKRGLNICAGTVCHAFDQFNGIDGFRDRLDNLCTRLNTFNAKYLVTMDESDVGEYSEKKKDFSKEVWDKYFTMFREMGKYTVEKYGIETVYHPHIRSLIETEQEILNLMDATGLNLCLDTGHFAYVNGKNIVGDRSNQEFILRFSDRIKYLHFKNIDNKVFTRVKNENLDSSKAFDLNVMCDLEDGIIDYSDLKKTLDQVNFSGIAVDELDMPTASNTKIVNSAKHNLQYLRRIDLID